MARAAESVFPRDRPQRDGCILGRTASLCSRDSGRLSPWPANSREPGSGAGGGGPFWRDTHLLLVLRFGRHRHSCGLDEHPWYLWSAFRKRSARCSGIGTGSSDKDGVAVVGPARLDTAENSAQMESRCRRSGRRRSRTCGMVDVCLPGAGAGGASVRNFCLAIYFGESAVEWRVSFKPVSLLRCNDGAGSHRILFCMGWHTVLIPVDFPASSRPSLRVCGFL